MKNLYTFLIMLTAFIFLITSIGYCQDKEVRIYFGNGVWNNEEDARVSKKILQEHLENVLTTNDLKVSWDISYNPTDGLYDLFEAAQQSAGLAWTDFWRALAGLNLLPDFLQDELKKIAVKFDEDLIKTYPSIQEHVKRYNKDLCEGKKVVVVAHSQGNLFANIAYKGINKDTVDGFGIVSVANPSWYVAGDIGNRYYTTIDEDVIIGNISLALPSNVDNFLFFNIEDLTGHMFVQSYLAPGRSAESKILDDIVVKIDCLQWPEGGCKELLLITASVESGPRCVVLLDLDSNLKATNIPDNTGGYASFPCKESEISNWLSTVSKNGSSPLSIIQRSPATHVDTIAYNDPDMQHSREIGNLGYGCQTLQCYTYIDTCTKNFPTKVLTYQRVEKSGSSMDDLAIILFMETLSEYYENAPFLSNITLTSLTSFGGTKKRKNKGSFKFIEDANLCYGWEKVDWRTGAYTAGQYYPCSGEVPGTCGSKDEINYYNELTAESPFKDRTEISINLATENKHNFRYFGWFADRPATPVSCETLSKQESFSEYYTCGGVLYEDRLIVFYTDEFTITTKQKNVTTGWVWNGGGLGGTPSECVNGFLTDAQPPYPEYEITYKKEFELKAFNEKASPVGDTPGDAMNLDPFTIQEDLQIEEILKSLKSFAESISPVVPENRCELLTISMSIVN